MTIIGPGDSPDVRLVNLVQVEMASAMRLETGDAQQVVTMDVASRTLASAQDTDVRTYLMQEDQAQALAEQLWAVSSSRKADLDRVLMVLEEIEAGEHATTGRQFGQGMAHAVKLIRKALDA